MAHVIAAILAIGALAWLALARRHRPAGPVVPQDRLAYASLAVAAWLALPFLLELGRGPAPEVAGAPLKVATANILSRKGPHPDAVRELLAVDADLLVITEFHPNWRRALDEPLGATHPHRVLRPREDAFGLGVYSRFPLGEPRALAGMPYDIPLLRIEVQLPGGPVALFAVHTMPPRTPEYLHGHRQMVHALLSQVDPAPTPAFLVGDFNFGVNTPQHRALLRRGFRDGYTDGARGHGKTWPVLDFTRFLPGMRLDHVYARGFTCIEAGLGHGYNTDHRPVWSRWAR